MTSLVTTALITEKLVLTSNFLYSEGTLQPACSNCFPIALSLHQECPYIECPCKEKLLYLVACNVMKPGGAQKGKKALPCEHHKVLLLVAAGHVDWTRGSCRKLHSKHKSRSRAAEQDCFGQKCLRAVHIASGCIYMGPRTSSESMWKMTHDDDSTQGDSNFAV